MRSLNAAISAVAFSVRWAITKLTTGAPAQASGLTTTPGASTPLWWNPGTKPAPRMAEMDTWIKADAAKRGLV
jgi:hypothetical protein